MEDVTTITNAMSRENWGGGRGVQNVGNDPLLYYRVVIYSVLQQLKITFSLMWKWPEARKMYYFNHIVGTYHLFSNIYAKYRIYWYEATVYLKEFASPTPRSDRQTHTGACHIMQSFDTFFFCHCYRHRISSGAVELSIMQFEFQVSYRSRTISIIR